MDSFSFFGRFVAISTLLSLNAGVALAAPVSSALPSVNLGYGQYSGTTNPAGKYYTFSNIRYAAPPVGQLRFAAPAAPEDESSLGVQDGSVGNICSQARPSWLDTAISGLPADYASSTASNNATQSEDCLFLDVIVPTKVFNEDHTTAQAPVLVWVHGGLYSFGSKNADFDATNILSQSNDNLIIVSINYRLGAFGFLSTDGATPNTGLLDQRFALKWVRDKINLFGGNGTQITVMGEDAGAASIVHQLGAYLAQRLDENRLFQSAVVQSPAIFNLAPTAQQKAASAFLGAGGFADVASARSASAEQLVAANIAAVKDAVYGLVNFGPVVDGTAINNIATNNASLLFAPPNLALQRGIAGGPKKFLTSTTLNEGRLFADQSITTESAFTAALSARYPQANATLLSTLASYYNSTSYPSPLDRWTTLVADETVNCNVNILDRYFQRTYTYRYSIPPALHFSDLPATTFSTSPAGSSGVGSHSPSDPGSIIQAYIAQLALTGNPNRDALQPIPNFGGPEGRVILDFAQQGIETIPDPNMNERCRWWELGLLYM